MLKSNLGKTEIFKQLNSNEIWKENDIELIYEPVKLTQSSRDDSFNPVYKSSHRILVSKFDSRDLSSILPKKEILRKKEDNGYSKIIIIADDGFGKTSTLKFIFLEYKRQFESKLDNSKNAINKENILTEENELLVPIFIDLEKLVKELDWDGRKQLIEKIAEFLKISPLQFTECNNNSYIFLFDNIDKVPYEKARNIIKDLKSFRYHFIISTKREFSQKGRIDDEWPMYEILPLSKSQILNLIQRIIEHHNSKVKDKDKIEISNSKRFAAFLPFVLLPAEAKKPHFISIYTEKIIEYIKSKPIPESPSKNDKLAIDETYKFLDQITPTSIDTDTSFAFIKEAREKVFEIIAHIDRYESIDVEDLCKKTNSFFSSSFFFQKLFVKEFIENLLIRNESAADELLDSFVDEIIEAIKDYSPFSYSQESDSSTQICFEYLAIIVRYLRNFYHEKYYCIQKKIFFSMKELYDDNQKHYFIRSNALWLMRLSYNIEDKDLRKYGEKFPYSVRVPLENSTFEDFDLFYSELLFIMKCCLNNTNIKRVTTLIKDYSEFCPFSGLIFYLYLIYQRNSFASEVEPLLTAIDTEPKHLKVTRFSSNYSLVVRTIQAIGALGNRDDIDIFIDHGFLDIYSSREFKEDSYSSIERLSYYAIEELFFHKLEPNFDSLLVNPYLSNLKEIIQNKIPYLFDDINQHISIYASVCKNIDETIRNTDRSSDRILDDRNRKINLKTHDYYLLEKSVMILTEISKQYFRDKSYRSQRGKLIVSLYLLNDELKKIHEQAGTYLIEGDNQETSLHFEDQTVKIMQEIVKSYTKEEPEDLIELSKVSFRNWLDNYQLKNSDKPFFSSYINNSSAKEVSAHVVKSNLDILERVMSKQLITTLESNKEELVILDIGSGVGNTSEAVIEKYSMGKNQKKKVIYAVELLPEYVKHYCKRIGITTAIRYCYGGLNNESINYEVHIINEDIHKILGKFCDKGKLYFDSYSRITSEMITNVFQDQECTSSAILNYLKENSSKENEILLQDLEKYTESDKIYYDWLELMENSLNIYSRFTDNESKCCKAFRFKSFDLVIANYSLHHLTSDYRKDVYLFLLKCSSPGAFFAVSDPKEGLSDKNRRYFNFTDEGVFACFMSRDECIKEVEGVCILEDGIGGVKGYKWVNICPENIENEQTQNGFIAIFQKKIIKENKSNNPIDKGKLTKNISKTIKMPKKNIGSDRMKPTIGIITALPEERMEPTIGIITALPKEYVAVSVLLENKKDKYKIPGSGAGRQYCLGEITTKEGNKHSLVLAMADKGNNFAAARAPLLLEHFPNVKSIIMVGIAGGVPNPKKSDDHVRLGDIVVSNENGVIQYDLIKKEIQKITHRNPPRPPSASLLEAVRYLEAEEILGNRPWEKYIYQALSIIKTIRPSDDKDILYFYDSQEEIIKHPEDPKRIEGQPRIFTGLIASANILQKDPKARDKLRDKFGVKAIEMEASGIADATWNHEVGYLVVRGICDYCDPHKNDEWQQYAAVVAAAYTRALIESMP